MCRTKRNVNVKKIKKYIKWKITLQACHSESINYLKGQIIKKKQRKQTMFFLSISNRRIIFYNEMWCRITSNNDITHFLFLYLKIESNTAATECVRVNNVNQMGSQTDIKPNIE